MSNAFISWLSLFNEHNPFGTTGKLAAIWFDNLIIETPSQSSFHKPIEVAIERGIIPLGIRDLLLDHWKPVQNYLPDFSYEPVQLDSGYHQLWDTVTETVYYATESEFPNHPKNENFAREVGLASHGLIRAYISWFSLNALDATSFITNEREQTVAKELFIREEKRDFDIFRHFADIRIPDLSELAWERVWDLRYHPRIEAFRKRITDASGANTSVASPDIAQEIEADFVANLEEFAKLCEPAPLKSLARTAISNIPLPIPINPVSVAFGNKEFWEELEREKTYGWMFFGIDLRNASKP